MEGKKYSAKGKVYVSSVIEAPVEAVWGRTCRFADGSWMPGVSASGYVGTIVVPNLILRWIHFHFLHSSRGGGVYPGERAGQEPILDAGW
jgi:hypothetical protein